MELLPESEWSCPSEIVLQEDETDPGDLIEDDKDILDKCKPEVVEKTPTGKVVGIIRRKWRQYCGILQKNLVEGGTRHIFVPADRKIPKIRIETRQAEKLQMQRIVVAIDTWPRHSRYPSGHFVRALGPLGDKDTENEVILLEHDVPHANFSEEVLACLPELPWIITEEVRFSLLFYYQFCIEDSQFYRFLQKKLKNILQKNILFLNQKKYLINVIRIVKVHWKESLSRRRDGIIGSTRLD